MSAIGLMEAIQTRRSVRAFKPDSVPRQVLEEMMGVAVRAPSWANTQPWEFAIVTGKKLEDIRHSVMEALGRPPMPDFPGPRGLPAPFGERTARLGKAVARAAVKEEGDGDFARWWFLQGLMLYGAPAAIYLYLERSLYERADGVNVWPVFDCGLVAQNIMLLATGYGLGTIAQMQAVHYPDIIRAQLGIPDSKSVLLGISIGYPDPEAPINTLHSEREELEKVVHWYGFD